VVSRPRPRSVSRGAGRLPCAPPFGVTWTCGLGSCRHSSHRAKAIGGRSEGQSRMEPMEHHGEALARISTGLVQLHSRYYGKGPTKAKTFLVNDTVICILRGGFTTVERTLIDEGNVEAVYDIRRSFQRAMEEPFRAVVEGSVGR